MKSKIILIMVFLSALFIALPNAYAYDWSNTSINSGYALTTDYHGKDVPMGATVTARAGTTDLSITTVYFRWLKPNGAEAWAPVKVTTFSLDTYNGKTVRVFVSTGVPDQTGDWGVQALFYDSGGHGRGPLAGLPEKVAVKGTSFFVVPEIAFGTIAVLSATFGALGIFALKKKRTR